MRVKVVWHSGNSRPRLGTRRDRGQRKRPDRDVLEGKPRWTTWLDLRTQGGGTGGKGIPNPQGKDGGRLFLLKRVTSGVGTWTNRIWPWTSATSPSTYSSASCVGRQPDTVGCRGIWGVPRDRISGDCPFRFLGVFHPNDATGTTLRRHRRRLDFSGGIART